MILFLSLILSALSAFAGVGDVVVDGGLNYKIISLPNDETHGTVEVGNNSSYAGPVSIPASITLSGTDSNAGTYDVVAIGVRAFYVGSYNTKVTSLDLSYATNLTTIGEQAFSNCVNFTGSLTIPPSVTTIETNAFLYCTGFTGSLIIGASVTSIGTGAFLGSKFTGSLTIGASVTTIKYAAFALCSGFTGSLTIPSSVTTIEP
ncbi:MAG: leucine-rich repeat domain-containing protein, partial [Tannerellaceae bacterium]|nr:leucine-rich repeat domain-containing protein [Tannerellaceae bacterium]